MIITQRDGITLEFTEGELLLHNNDEGIDIMNYEHLSIDLTKQDMLDLIEALLRQFVGKKHQLRDVHGNPITLEQMDKMMGYVGTKENE